MSDDIAIFVLKRDIRAADLLHFNQIRLRRLGGVSAAQVSGSIPLISTIDR